MGLFDKYDISDAILKDYLHIERRTPNLEERKDVASQ